MAKLESETMGRKKLLQGLMEFVLSEKSLKLLGQEGKTGGKGTCPARTLSTGDKLVCKSFNNCEVSYLTSCLVLRYCFCELAR